MSRYNSRRKAINKNEMYEKIHEERGVKQIEQYATPVFKNPSEKTLQRIENIKYYWKQGDKFWRLSSLHYGDPKLWWVIAQYNQKPTEAHLQPGDEIKIPIDLAAILEVLT